MKKTSKITAIIMIVAMLFSTFAITAFADTVIVSGDFEYEISSSGLIAKTYIGTDVNVTVPSALSGRPVVAIGSYCFNESNVETVTIPDSIESIGNYAFQKATSLKEITLPDSVTSIGINTFNGCQSLTKVVSLGSITTIPSYSFTLCPNLHELVLPQTVTTINDRAFLNTSKNDSGILNIYFPKSLTNISSIAFGVQTSPNYLTKAKIYGYSDSLSKTYADTYSFDFVSYDKKTDIKPLIDNKIDTTIYTPDTALAYTTAYNVAKTAYDADFVSEADLTTALTNLNIAISNLEEKPRVMGDINNDRNITIADVTSIQYYLAEAKILDADSLLYADVSGDGKITIQDGTLIQKYIANVISSFPCEN